MFGLAVPSGLQSELMLVHGVISNSVSQPHTEVGLWRPRDVESE
jgi:hypothetical protein